MDELKLPRYCEEHHFQAKPAIQVIYYNRIMSSQPPIATSEGSVLLADSGGDSNGPLLVLFLIVGMLMGVILREVNKRTKMPYTPMLLLCGILMGYFRESLGTIGQSTSIIKQLNPHMILLVFIPTLIFYSAFNCEWYVFRKSMVNILILAVPGVLWGAILIAVCFKAVLLYPESELTWYEALTLGCVLSATDPVAVVALLKQLGASVRFNTLVQGESLLNDGTAMVFFALFLDLVKGNATSLVGVVGNFVRTSIGGPLFGILFGMAISFWIKRIIRDNVLLVTVTVVGAYLCFYLGQFSFLKVSGILSIVSLGLYMSAVGKRKIYPESEEALHDIWSFLQHNCETLIFIITGIVVGSSMIASSTITYWDWVRVCIFWVLMIGVRVVMVLTFYPILRKTGYGITKKELVVLVYGGLRGALGLCLSLIVGVDESLSERFRQLTVFYMCGMAMLTILVNGLTCHKVVNYVQMIVLPQIKVKLLRKCIKEVLASTQQKLEELKNEPSVAYAEWSDVEKLVGTKNLGLTIYDVSSRGSTMGTFKQIKKSEMVDEIRFRFTRYLHKIYWHMYEKGEISEDSVALLSENCEIVNDQTGNKLNYFQLLSSNFLMETNKYYIKFKDAPLIGHACTKFLINKIYDVYEVSTAFIEACEEGLHVFEHSFPLNNQHLNYVLSEVRDNMEQSINYVFELQSNYPTVIKAVHTAKASTMLLNHKKRILEEMYNGGFVDTTDYSTLRKEISIGLLNVQTHTFELSDIKFNEVLTDCPLFASLPTHEIVSIRMKSNERLFERGTTIQAKGKEMKFVYFIVTGSVKEQFPGFYLMKSIGSVVNPHDFIYHEPSKATIKTVASTKAMQIQSKLITDLLDKYPQFKKKWYKSVFPYSLKFSKAAELIEKEFNERQQRRFIEGSVVVFLDDGQVATVEFGVYVFEGKISEVEAEGSTYTRGNFFFQRKVVKAEVHSVLLQFQAIAKFKTQKRGESVSESMDD